MIAIGIGMVMIAASFGLGTAGDTYTLAGLPPWTLTVAGVATIIAGIISLVGRGRQE